MGEKPTGFTWARPDWLAPGSKAAYAALVLFATAVFIPAFFAAFVWDDTIIVDFPEQVGGFADIWLNPSLIESEGHYWPVVYTTFWVENMLWGLDPVGYHVVNVVLHAANTMLVYALLRRLGVPGAWVAAAIFALHPTHVDSVAWAIERKDVLSALFYLMSALAYIRWDEHRRAADAGGRQRGTPGRRRRFGSSEAVYAGSLALFTLGLLSKSIVVTLPVTLLVYHWWRRGRVTGRELTRTIPFFAVAVGITLGDLAFYTAREAYSADISLAERVQIVSRSFWHYVQKLLWPSDLLPLYPQWDVDGGDPLGWGLLLAGIAVVVGLWVLRDRIGRGPLAGMLFFGVTLTPVLGFVNYGYMGISYVADRFQYLAGIGLIALVVGTVSHVAAKYEVGHWLNPTHVLSVLCVPALVLLGTITWRLALNYESEEKFFTYIVTNNPSARGGAYSNLGNALRGQGRTEDAIAMYKQSLENDKPNVELPLYNLGLIYDNLEEFDTAESYYRQALDLDNYFVSALGSLANLLVDKGEFTEAEELLQRALERKPNHPKILNNAAVLFEKKGDDERAEGYFIRGIDTNPNHDTLLANYGLFLYDNDRLVDAESIIRRALEENPQNSIAKRTMVALLVAQSRDDEAANFVGDSDVESLIFAEANRHVVLGNDLLKQEQLAEALEAYRAAVAIDPDHLAAHVQLGVVYENLHQNEEALASYRQAYEIDEKNISAVYFLGLLSARLEQYEEALVLFDEAEALFDDALVPTDETDANLPELSDVYLNRGFVLVQFGRLDEALASMERALELDPDLELAAHNRDQIMGMISQRNAQGG